MNTKQGMWRHTNEYLRLKGCWYIHFFCLFNVGTHSLPKSTSIPKRNIVLHLNSVFVITKYNKTIMSVFIASIRYNHE
jgi:hypothetical protein